MKLENYEVHLPNYSIGDQIYDKIGSVCESYGKKVLVIGGEKALAAAYDKIERYVKQRNLRRKLYLRHSGETAANAVISGSGHGVRRGWRKSAGYSEVPVHHG